MKELNLTDYLIIDKNGDIVEEYRICPNCNNKNYPKLAGEEYFYNCICQSCGHIMFPGIGPYGNEINHTVITKFISEPFELNIKEITEK